MEFKDYLFYILATLAVPYGLKQGYNMFGYISYLQKESPECYQHNPNFWTLFFGTWVVVVAVMVPVQAVAKSLFMKALPVDKFPLKSKAREIKATMVSERVFRFFVYSTTSIILFWLLKQSNFLDKRLMGTEEDP